MKYLKALIILFFLAACSKTSLPDNPTETIIQNPESCKFGLTQFNMSKRPAAEEGSERRPPKPPTGGGGTSPNPGVILLDFDGHLVSETNWNYNGDINCVPSNLTTQVMSTIMDRVINDFNPFNVIVTTDETVYNAATATKRMRVIITETWEWFGQVGGTSFLNSFTWGNNTPCFVFSSLLNYNEKQIAEAVSHEAGHTLGLRHQATYNGTTLVSEYNYGQGSGETGWAPVMGVGYYKNVTIWHNGPTPTGYTSFQNDVAVITGIVGVKTDDYSNSTSGAQVLTATPLNGIINSSTDADFFSVNLSAAKTVSLTPFNVGVNHEGANLDLIVKIYNSQGQLISSVQDPAVLNAISLVNAGQYFISVSTIANLNAGIYGMLGKYSISLN